MDATTRQAAQHTPGPWKAVDLNGEGLREVVRALPKGSEYGFVYPICEHITGHADEAAANAALIASAPTMRDALDAQASGLAEILAALDCVIERAQAGDSERVTSSLPIIRSAVESLRADAARTA